MPGHTFVSLDINSGPKGLKQEGGITFFVYLLVICARWLLSRHATTRIVRIWFAAAGSLLGIAILVYIERTTQPELLMEPAD
jgi:hypothetical protein